MNIGNRARFFDSKGDWKNTGDIGNNDIYMLPATVVNVWYREGKELADIRFDHRPNEISQGHFTMFAKSID